MQTLPPIPIPSQTLESTKYDTLATMNSSSSSIQSPDDEYRKTAIKWLLEFDRKVTRDTNYLAVWYLQTLLKNGFLINQANWQLIAASTILFSAKMNEIYPPSIPSIIKRCKPKYTNITCSTIIQMQGQILNYLQFSIAIQTPFNLISQILQTKKSQIQECQKLMKIIIYNKEICQFNDSITIAYAIIYLISRNTVDNQLRGQYRQKIKVVAQKMYNFYKDIRKNYEEQKEKERNHQTKPITFNNASQSLTANTSAKNITPFNLNTKQNIQSQEPFSSLSMKKSVLILKKFQSINQSSNSIQRVNSFKQVPKTLTENTSLPSKQKKLFNCLSKENLGYKDIYLYS